MNVREIPSQKWRAFFLFFYLFALVVISKIAFNQWFPPAAGGKAVWFYTGLASLLLGNHLVTPYFSKPVDAISYAIAAAFALISAQELSKWGNDEVAAYFLVLGYCTLVLIASFAAIFTRDVAHDWGPKVSKTCALLAAAFGHHRAVFGLTMVVAAYLFHRESVAETYLIFSVCLLGVVARPDEIFSGIGSRLKNIWDGTFIKASFATVIARQDPHIYLLRPFNGKALPFGTPVAIKTAGGSSSTAMTVDLVGRDDSNLLRCIDVNAFVADRAGIEPPSLVGTRDNVAVSISNESALAKSLENVISIVRSRLVGIVAADTSNDRLYFEVITLQPLEHGLLVEVQVQAKTVVYQILDALTKEEIVHQKNTLGIVKVEAQKVGIWDQELEKFIGSKWLPALNAPVLLASNPDELTDYRVVGRFPGSSYPVRMANVHHLVTHNTAILGILGVGKSMLAIELVERMLAEGIKVICLDLTDQYAEQLEDHYDRAGLDAKLTMLYPEGAGGKTNYKKNVEEGGSVQKVRETLAKSFDKFFESKTEKLKIFNPARFEVWKQDGKVFKDADIPPMTRLTACQMTQMISEVSLECVQKLGVTDQARVCLIYEEAHSLVPEWNSVAFEGDKTATAGTARAILQGRKYGLGCLLITQRTANVTKTILNQCNTIFAMRTFDDTGKEFLSNYVGRDYANTLSSLPERHAVFFGKASSCDNPVLIQLNDKDQFRKTFRAQYPIAKSETSVFPHKNVEAPKELTADTPETLRKFVDASPTNNEKTSDHEGNSKTGEDVS